MKFLLLFPLLILFLIACSTTAEQAPRYSYKYVDKRAIKYVKRFEKFAGFKIPFVRIAFVQSFGIKHEKKKTIGLCTKIDMQIYLPGYKWDDMTDLEKEELVFHEIGHCVLGRGHNEHKIKDSKCPYSIMWPKQIGDKCYKRYRKHYIKELLEYKKPNKLRYK